MSVKISAFVIVMITALWLVPKNVSAQNQNINLQVFYDELGNYGTWVDNPQYGYVWVPNVDGDFRPYVTNGHWVFTDYGWTWSSDYEWGWAAFHYGRWFWDEEYGNVWVPGTEWGPAWVVWKKAPGYYGWAPMTPGMSNLYSSSNEIPVESWSFVRDRDLLETHLDNYFVDPMRNNLIRLSSLIFSMRYDTRFNHNYIYGPSQNEFQRSYGRNINMVHIYDNNRPGQNMNGDRYSIYRPVFYKNGNASYSESHPLSYLKNKERINSGSNNYYRNPREKETGRPNGLYNSGSRNAGRNYNQNEPGRPNNDNRGSNVNGSARQGTVTLNNNNNSNNNSNNNPTRNNNYNNRGSNANGSGRLNSSTQNNNSRGSNTSRTGNSNTPANNTPNNSNNRGSNANGRSSSNTPASTAPGNNNSRGSNASGTGSSNTPATTPPTNNNAGKGNARETLQANKPATNQPNAAADASKAKPASTTTPQTPVVDPKAKGQKGKTAPTAIKVKPVI